MKAKPPTVSAGTIIAIGVIMAAVVFGFVITQDKRSPDSSFINAKLRHAREEADTAGAQVSALSARVQELEAENQTLKQGLQAAREESALNLAAKMIRDSNVKALEYEKKTLEIEIGILEEEIADLKRRRGF